jgi:hypothetical protein
MNMPFVRGPNCRVLQCDTIALICATLICLVSACSSRTEGDEQEDIGVRKSATFVCNNVPVLSLDSALLWTAVSGTISNSTRRVEGLGSVRLAGPAHAEFKSAPTCTAVFTPGKIAFSVAATSASAPEVNTTVTVTFNSLFGGLALAQVGTRQVTLTAGGRFTRLEFEIPPSIATVLSVGSPDLGITVAFDGQTSQDFLIDDMSITPASITPVPGTGALEAATITINYPKNTDLTKTALLGQAQVTLSNNVSMIPDYDGLGITASAGTLQTNIGTSDQTGPIVSKPKVVIGASSTVTGDVTSASTITRGTGVVVTGQLRPATAVTPLSTLSWRIEYKRGTAPVTLTEFEGRSIPPGAYTDVTVPFGAKLGLSTGTYYFTSLSVLGGGLLTAATDGGPVVVYVKTAVTYAADVQCLGPPGQLVLVYTGTSPLFLQTPFDGFVVAPKSDVRLAAGVKGSGGAIFAKTVLLDPFVVFAPRNTFPIFTASSGGVGGNRTECTNAITLSPFGQSATKVQLQTAILKYCGGTSVGPCELGLRAQARVDFAAAATQLLQGTLAPCKYMTFLKNRERRLDEIHANESLACSILNGDPDGDFIPTSRDSCPNTPALAAVLDSGCTDTACPPTPPLADIKAGMPEYAAIAVDPRCKNAPTPKGASPFGAWRFPPDPSVGKALWVSRDPDTTGCPKFYILQAKLTDGSQQTVVYRPEEDVTLPWIQRPTDVLQFNLRATDPGGRGSWARYSVYTDEYRVRVVNAAGQRSAWSSWYAPKEEGCAAGGPCGD